MTDVVIHPRRRSASSARAHRVPLRVAASLFGVATLLHNADHLRRGVDSVGTDVVVVGALAILLEIAVVMIVFGADPWAPAAAIAAGFGLAAGYVVVHLTPARAHLSDSIWVAGTEAVTVAAVMVLTAASLALGGAGVLAFREQPAGAIRPRRARWDPAVTALRHPLVLVTATGNGAILAASLVAG